MSFHIALTGYPADVAAAVVPGLVGDLVASGITNEDPTLWGAAAEPEAAIRLGWVRAIEASRPLVPTVNALRADFLARGVDRFVLAGMGGSSLAADVIARTAGVDLVILDSTAPAQVLDALDGDGDDLRRTALIVASKSGATLETDAARCAFEAAYRDLGIDPAQRMVVVTDPDSPLDEDSRAAGYRVFNAQPDVGGRFAALTAFGIVPAGLAGANIEALLDDAEASLLELAVDDPANPGLILGAVIGGTLHGYTRKDKLGLVNDTDTLPGLPDWVEQLVAESTGKLGTGILPVVLLPVSMEVEETPDDVQLVRFVADVNDLGIFDDHHSEVLISATLGAQFVVWEYAVAVAARLLGVNPFDQPDVESAKAATRALLQERAGSDSPAFIEDDIEVRANRPDLLAAGTVRGVLDALFAAVGADGYVAIQAYVDRSRLAPLSGLRELVAADAGRPTTFGWGPRFLHSTGQYHKGGPANGVFLQILESTSTDAEIPGTAYTFGHLLVAQAAGDARVLTELGRPIVTLTLTDPETDVLELFEAAD